MFRRVPHPQMCLAFPSPAPFHLTYLQSCADTKENESFGNMQWLRASEVLIFLCSRLFFYFLVLLRNNVHTINHIYLKCIMHEFGQSHSRSHHHNQDVYKSVIQKIPPGTSVSILIQPLPQETTLDDFVIYMSDIWLTFCLFLLSFSMTLRFISVTTFLVLCFFHCWEVLCRISAPPCVYPFSHGRTLSCFWFRGRCE